KAPCGDAICWDGGCILHGEFKSQGVLDLKAAYPDAAVLVHPESPKAVIELADVVGSTSQLIRAAGELKQERLIVATDKGIFYKMQQMVHNKILMEAPTAGAGDECQSCAQCT